MRVLTKITDVIDWGSLKPDSEDLINPVTGNTAMARTQGHRGWRALVFGDALTLKSPQTPNERQALALASALLETSSQVSARGSGWNVQTASLASVHHPMPRLYRPLASDCSTQSEPRAVALARKHLPSALLFPFESREPQSVLLPAPFDHQSSPYSTIVISSTELVARQSLIARDRISNSKLIHISLPRKIPHSEFDAIVAAAYEKGGGHDEDGQEKNVITSPLALHDVTSQRLNSHAEQQPCHDILALQSPRLALFLGEPGVLGPELWSDAGASRLSQQLTSIAGSDGSVVVVASSSTPDAFVRRLQRMLTANLGQDRVMYDDGSSRARHLFLLATSDGIVISADCLMTVSEAVTAVSAPLALVGVGSSTESYHLAHSMASAGRVLLLNDSNCASFRVGVESRRTAPIELNGSKGDERGILRVAAAVWNTILS